MFNAKIVFPMALLLSNAFPATVIQAESFTSKDNGTVSKSGGGVTYMDFALAANAYIEWNNITVADAGEYKVTLTYANGVTANEAVKVKLLVNDGSQVNASSTALQTLPYTGGWSTFKTASFIVRLNSGTNKIRITQSTTEGPNIDYITLYAAKTKVYTGVLNDNGDAIPGLSAGPNGNLGIPETLTPSQVRGYSCYLSYTSSTEGIGTACFQTDDGNYSVYHGYVSPGNYVWQIHQWDANGEDYSLEVRYWE